MAKECPLSIHHDGACGQLDDIEREIDRRGMRGLGRGGIREFNRKSRSRRGSLLVLLPGRLLETHDLWMQIYKSGRSGR